MNDQWKESLLLAMRNAVADKEAAIACANLELQTLGDWRRNWEGLIEEASKRFDGAMFDFLVFSGGQVK